MTNVRTKVNCEKRRLEELHLKQLSHINFTCQNTPPRPSPDLQGAVHQAHHQLELLVIQDGLVADHVLRELVAEHQTRRLVLQGPQNGRERLPRVRDLRLEYAAHAVTENLAGGGGNRA